MPSKCGSSSPRLGWCEAVPTYSPPSWPQEGPSAGGPGKRARLWRLPAMLVRPPLFLRPAIPGLPEIAHRPLDRIDVG
jgi:hypothetical protein